MLAFFFLTFTSFHSLNNYYRAAATPDENEMPEFNKSKENKENLH